MTEQGNRSLGDFHDDRPDAEAEEVAGADTSRQGDVVDPDRETLPEATGAVELRVMQVDYTIEGYGSEETPIVHVFGRTAGGTLEHVRVRGFEPYFYVPATDVDEDELLRRDRLTGVEAGFESIRGEELCKVFGQTPRDVGQIRDEFDHYEADVLFPNRLLIDCGIESGVRVPERRLGDAESPMEVHHEELEPVDVLAEPRVHTLDIEVNDREGFPEDGEEPIICLTAHDSYRDEYVGWVFEPDDADTWDEPDDLDGYEPITEGADVQLRTFETEAAMLDDYLEYVEETNPDVMTGWNFDDFDAPYLLDRLEEVDAWPDVDRDLSIERLSRVDEVWRSNWGAPDVKGRVVFDLLYAYQRTQFTELDSYRLDDVAEMELGVGKERYMGDLGDLWEADPEQLLEYNVRDVELCVELDRKQDVIAFWDEVRSFVGCKLEDATTPGDAVDMYVLHKVHDEFVLPSKGQQEGEEYEGGAVFDPITGVREMVSVLDLKSLYPMCMVTTNASPETKVDPTGYDGETYVAPNGTHFRKEPDGIIREMVDELLAERDQKKALRDEHDPDASEYEQFDQQQAAVKVIMNCFTPDTDVLTPEGVRNIRDLDVGDDVYSLDPDSERLEVKPVVDTHAYPDYRDELIEIQTSKIDFSVTPNHRMLVRKNDANGITQEEWDFVEAGDLYDYCHYELPHGWEYNHGEGIEEIDLVALAESHLDLGTEISDCGEYVAADGGSPTTQRFVDGDDFVRLLGWYVTEGNTFRNGDGTTQYTQIAQANADGRESIEALLDRAMRTFSTEPRDFRISGRVWRELFETLCGTSSDSKRIPDLVEDCSERQKWLLLETLIDGDGDWNDSQTSFRYTTLSDELRDDVVELCLQLGLTPKYTRDSGCWRIHVDTETKNSFRMHRDGSQSTAENGVYCVTVADNNTLVAGRNGRFQHVGNSLYGVLGWDRFRLYDQEMGAAVTATGREVIKHTEEAANELDRDVIYGDTDSVMLELGGDVSTDEAIERSFEIEEHINESYDQFAREELNAHVHRFQIEFEKLYRRFFQAGKKKRYAGHIIWKEGKEVDDVDITGFEYQRSDIAPITKDVQKRVIDMIVHGEETEAVADYVYDVIEDFQAGNVSPEDVGIPGGIGKRLDNYDTDTAQVRGAKFANLLLGTNFARGSKPKRLYLEGVHPDFFRRMEREVEEDERLDPQCDPLYREFKEDVRDGDGVICIEYADQLPEEFEIDWEKMLDKTLKGPIERILEALDVTWEEVESGQEQTGLESFM